MKKLSPAQIGADIQRFFPYFGSDKTNKDGQMKFRGGFKTNGSELETYAGKSDLFHDLCQMGALLTDEHRCVLHLTSLSELMAEKLVHLSQDSRYAADKRLKNVYVAQNKIVDHDASGKTDKGIDQFKDLKNLIKTEDDYLKKWLETNPPKFYGVLNEILLSQEIKWGFNGGDKASIDEGEMVSIVELPTLSGFVHPESFESLLLKQVRHWKDPGASAVHGEYTHRLQWWIVCCENEKMGPYHLRKPPAKRFAQLAKYKTEFWKDAIVANNGGLVPAQFMLERTMWDFIFDCIPTKSRDFNVETTITSDSFRSPQYMNMYLTDPVQCNPKLAVLQNYLVARFNKRILQKTIHSAYKEVLAKKWGLSSDEFDKLYADESKYGKLDMEEGVLGKVVVKPKKEQSSNV